MPSAGTTSQLYIVFYGHLKASAPVFLYSNEKDIFQSGHEDTFDINIGDIGEAYKIRIGHTNSGDSPGWYCEEVQLLNIFSNEQFCIKVNRWLSRDKDDGEICREIPVPRNGHSKLPLTKYKIEVVTGDLWNAGTEANVYISLQGQYGDTGSRQLYRSNKPSPFIKGQTDSFFLEAVHLGDLHTIIIGHDGLEPGNGWYLEKVIVHDEVYDKEYKFLCYRWLDEGEEDGKIVRKLSVTNEADFPARFELEVKKKEMWTAERWKYQNQNCVQFYCKATGKFIRLTPDGRVDALGDKKDEYGFFDVLVKRGKVRVFRSHHIRHLALPIDKGMVAAMDNNGILCELQLHIQANRSITLESTRMPGMTISFNSHGEPANDGMRGYADIAKEFIPHVKGMFHSGAVVLLATSWSQALCLRSDGSCSGAGKQKVESYWRVHKVGPAVCMFENVTHPRKFLRIKSGICDGEGTGDEYCQFKVEKNYENGSVTLESVRSRGIYIGLLPNGFAKPMIHTGEHNILFYPQVIKFGREKPTGTSATLRQKKEEILPEDEVIEETQGPVARSPSASPPSSEYAEIQETSQYSENYWKVSILTGSAGTSAIVTLWVYGSKGSTGPITLGKGKNNDLFRPRQEDEFMVDMPNIGKLYKIRIGHDGRGDHHEWELKRIILQKMKNAKTYTFEANKWLSKHHGNGDLMCELPVVEDGAEIYPVVKYKINIYTGHLEQAGTDAPVYICLYGERGDSGQRALFRPGLLNPFQRGQVDVFEIEAVSLGKLRRVLLGCEANHKSQYWYCEKVIIREQGELSECIFNCERWLPYMSQGALHSEIELLKQEEELPSEVRHPTKANVGEWRITLVTGNFPNAGTDATVFLYVYDTEGSSGPIMLGSGSHQLFNVNSADTFQINVKYLHKPYKIRIGHDNSGDDPAWYLEEVKLYNLSSDQEFYLPVNRWLGEDHDDGDTWREFPLSTDAKDPLEVLDYEIQVYTGAISDDAAEANVYIHVFGNRGDSGKRKLHKSKFQTMKFKKGQVDIFSIQAVSLGTLEKIKMSCDGGNGWFLDKVIIQYTEDGNLIKVLFPCNRWLDKNQEDGRTERELIATERENPEEDTDGKLWNIQITTANDSLLSYEMNVNVIIYGRLGNTNDFLLLQKSGIQYFFPGSRDEFLVTLKYVGEIYKICIVCDHLPAAPGWHLESINMVEQETGQEVQFDCNCWIFADSEEEEAIKEFRVFSNPQERMPGKLWNIQITTANDSLLRYEMNINVIIYGSDGKTIDFFLQKNHEIQYFYPGSRDEFFVTLKDVGEIYKIRIVCDHLPAAPGWHLESINMVEQETGQVLQFDCNCWIFADSEEVEAIKEFRVFSNPQELIPVSGKLWNIQITTANDSLLSYEMNINVIIYGSDGKTIGFFIHKNHEIQYFYPGSRDDFLVTLKDVGEIYKIRIVCDHLPAAPGWHLESINMVEQETRQEVQFDCNCWIFADSEEEEAIKEFWVFSNPQELIPVSGKLWNIQITTANDSLLSYEMNINVIIYGSDGKTIGFFLHKNHEIQYFYPGSRDDFLVTLKDVGEIYKIRIVCDHLPAAPGWHLENINMVEQETRQEVQFDCNCWIFADSEEDEAIKEFRVFSNPQELISGKLWNIQITTANDSLLSYEMNINVIIYGKDGKTNDFFLPKNSEIQYFYPGSRDEFLVPIKDVGEIYKIRIVCDHLPAAPGWHLESINMVEQETRKEVQFDSNRWIFADDGEDEAIKECRVLNDQQELIPVNQYIVSVHTGDHWGAETLANVYITLYGERGDTGARKLHKSSIPGDKFTRNKVDSFELQAVSLGQLRKVVLGLDREGYGAGMYLKMVTIKESEDSHTEWVFPLWNWLDSHLGLCKTVCKLYTTGKRLSKSPVPIADFGGSWIIDISGSGFENAENLNSFSLSFYGNGGKAYVEITIDGDILQVKDELQVGTIYKVQVSWSHTQVFTSWFLSSIHMKHTVTNQEMWLNFQLWIRPNEDRRVEIPAMYPYEDPLPVVEYNISVHTGDEMDGRCTGRMYICITGEHGDTGNRVLNAPDADVISFTKGQMDVFTIKAVYLGQLQKIVLGFNNLESDSWFLEKIIVKEDFTCSSNTFLYNDWLRGLSGQEFTKSEILLTDSAVELNKISSFNTPTKGKWQLRVLGTPTLEENGNALSVVVFGKNGKSSPQNVTNLNWDPILLSVGNMENIIKASFLSMGLSSERRLHLQKIRMKDVDTNQEIGFYPDKVYLPGEDGFENVAEVAAVLPNQPPLEEVTYSIYVKTGDFPASSTDAEVFITLYGENGDSCKRRLMHLLLPGVFCKGKISVFKIKAVDLGMLSSLHIEHNAVGYGAGWYLDQITIQKSDKADIKYLFPCQRWLDTAINDKQTGCELKLLGKFNRTNEKLLTSSEGTINIIMVTDDIPNAGTNSNVFLTICCENGNYESVTFDKGALSGGRSIHTVELNGGLGCIQKVRLQMEDDGKDNSWFCKMVQLQHVQSGDILEFPFLQTFGSKENNFVAELPVLKPSGPLLTVKTYYISISISQAPKPITDIDLFITLSGTMGNTGRRKVKCKRKALSSKMVGFQLKTVDIGIIHKLLIEKEKLTNLQLEKAVVEEGSFIKNKYIFIAQPWRKEKTKMMSMTLQVTETKEDNSSEALLNEVQSMTSDGEWNIYLTISNEEIQISQTLQHNLQWIILFYGDKGRSNPLRLEEKHLDQWRKDRLTYKVNLKLDLGELFKVRLGIENWYEDLGRLSLCHLKMQNTRTLDTFNQSINKTLPLSLSGDRWIEIPVEWPLRASLSAVTYSVTIVATELTEQKDQLYFGICLHGKHGDTGHRYINWQYMTNENEDESFTAILDAVELGEVHQADISMSSSNDCNLYIKRIHVKDSSKKELYVFIVDESFSIESKMQEIRKEVVLSQIVHDHQEETDDGLLTPNDKGTVEEDVVEYKIMVYTGDIKEAGTKTNVYIILFYENGNSFGPVQLKTPLEDIRPFQNGQVDTFIVTTKNKGKISHIEIGHDGKGLGNGWFLEKLEIIRESTEETVMFPCNRWLAEDEEDGRTAIQLYL